MHQFTPIDLLEYHHLHRYFHHHLQLSVLMNLNSSARWLWSRIGACAVIHFCALNNIRKISLFPRDPRRLSP
ncbi:unnamed protein product [Coffea canephora]|uniref:Uncharacterized protein n=1 Tax=Coffea canephora TaxID=49390 RepID=A0A068UEH6_COFCA|nr:unnamed protein product [Coffea canephora]